MNAMASQITSLTIVYSTVYSGADQRKHQSSASLVTGEFPAQRASNAIFFSIWLRHHWFGKGELIGSVNTQSVDGLRVILLVAINDGTWFNEIKQNHRQSKKLQKKYNFARIVPVALVLFDVKKLTAMFDFPTHDRHLNNRSAAIFCGISRAFLDDVTVRKGAMDTSNGSETPHTFHWALCMMMAPNSAGASARCCDICRPSDDQIWVIIYTELKCFQEINAVS